MWSPIILSYYGLCIDLENHRLSETVTFLKRDCEVNRTSEFVISTVNKILQYSDLLSQFMGVTTTSPSNYKPGTSVLQHIVTTGPPVAERPRRLTGEKLTFPEAEFDYMLERGIYRLPMGQPASLSIKGGGRKENLWRLPQVKCSHGTRSLSYR
jgi:cleavage and polyadenylation specificity factor subunit 1